MRSRLYRHGLIAALFLFGAAFAEDTSAPLPQRLSDTGLFAPGAPAQLRDNVFSFSPQYPLWSDGASKRRWISLPAGTAIDASNPTAWEFPRGTKLWKEFAHGRPQFRLRALVGLPEPATNGHTAMHTEQVVIVEVADRRAGLVVDELAGQQEIVVKQYDPVREGLKIFGGATILGDGSPALIVDVSSIC